MLIEGRMPDPVYADPKGRCAVSAPAVLPRAWSPQEVRDGIIPEQGAVGRFRSEKGSGNGPIGFLEPSTFGAPGRSMIRRRVPELADLAVTLTCAPVTHPTDGLDTDRESPVRGGRPDRKHPWGRRIPICHLRISPPIEGGCEAARYGLNRTSAGVRPGFPTSVIAFRDNG